MAYFLQYTIFEKLLTRDEAVPTAGNIPLSQLAIDSDHKELCIGYDPAPRMIIRWLHAYLPKNPSAWTFLDIGAGRGRVLLEAARFPYKRVTGIEFSGDLCDQAQKNIDTYGNQKKAKILEIKKEDATSFDIPEGPCIFFLFNPFTMPVFEKFLQHVLLNLEEDKHLNYIFIIYNPICPEVFSKFRELIRLKIPHRMNILFKLFSPFAVQIYMASRSQDTADVWRR